MKHAYHAAFVLLFLALAGCGSASGNPVAVVPTEPPASAALPTPTPLPGVIASGDQLGLGAEFGFVCRDCLAKHFPAALQYAAGIKELRNSTYPTALIPWLRFPIKSFFAFTNGDYNAFASGDNTKWVEGFSVALKGPEEQAEFDQLFVTGFYANWKQGVQQWTPDASEIKGVAVGDESVGVTAQPTIDGFAWRLDAVSFRVGNVGAFVFSLYPAAEDAPGDILRIAQMYADSIKP